MNKILAIGNTEFLRLVIEYSAKYPNNVSFVLKREVEPVFSEEFIQKLIVMEERKYPQTKPNKHGVFFGRFSKLCNIRPNTKISWSKKRFRIRRQIVTR